MLPEEKARVKIDKQLRNAGWDIVARNEYLPNSTSAVKEALMGGNTESDYLLFVDGKAIAVVEAKREENPLGDEVKKQAEDYAVSPQAWYGLWFEKLIPLVYMANGNKIYFKNMLVENSDYEELSQMHSPKKMLQIVGKKSEYGALPLIEKRGLRDCQYRAEVKFEESLKMGNKKNLAVLATGSGKTYLACLASYRLLNYTPTKRILFLVDRNNLARQTESEFSVFDRTEGQQKMGNLYTINRLKKEEDIKGDIVISTIQKLFCVLTGQAIDDSDEDAEDEKAKADEEKDSKTVIDLGNDLKLPPDYFQLIIVDECHRSIYGKWKKVLDYFSSATVLGLTATPTPEAYAYFNKNVIEEYTYDDSVVDGVNVPPRVYRIITDITAHGGTIENGAKITETSKRTGKSETIDAGSSVEYGASELDRSVVNKKQIKEVLMAYKKAIYEDLYPSRERKWEYIPKTLIFAKSDPHANDIVEIVEEVFKVEFENGKLPKNFVKKITYTAGDSNALIRDLRTEKDFRIAVTVTLVATGTDVKPLEVVLFMKDVHSDVLYTQMKGRGCRVISDDKLKEVTPNADTKECYYIVDAVGVTESEKHIPKPGPDGSGKKNLSLEHLLERLAHNEVSDDNLLLLRDYCSKALQACFSKSYQFIKTTREMREPGDRTMIRLPEECKEYLAIYTTEYDDSYILETIVADDIVSLRQAVSGQNERVMEAEFNYDVEDSSSTILETERIVKIRKLNKKIGDNLKLLYGYRCQICGQLIGEEFGSHIVEAHHIDYFVSSLNNDASNQLIVCPNHHSIIHDTNPVFDRRRLLYIYKNGLEQKLVLNQHL